MKIGGLQKSSLLDYPGKISAIIFTQGCNFLCGYCHNSELLDDRSNSTFYDESVLEFLKTRVGLLDGVVISGGEPCLQEDIVAFAAKIKSLGFLIKLDTNGSYPEVLEELMVQNLVDYIAMDIKAPIEKYNEIVCTKIFPEKIQKSIELIKNAGVDYEFRTTVVKSQLSMHDFEKIGEMIKGVKRYYLQKFVSSKLVDEKFKNAETYSDEEFEIIAKKLKEDIKKVEIR